MSAYTKDTTPAVLRAGLSFRVAPWGADVHADESLHRTRKEAEEHAAGVVREVLAHQRWIRSELNELRVYLTSPKFYQDTTVQVADVLRRLEAAEVAAADAAALVRDGLMEVE